MEKARIKARCELCKECKICQNCPICRECERNQRFCNYCYPKAKMEISFIAMEKGLIAEGQKDVDICELCKKYKLWKEIICYGCGVCNDCMFYRNINYCLAEDLLSSHRKSKIQRFFTNLAKLIFA